MDKVYQVVMTLKDTKRVIHVGMFTSHDAAIECMNHADARHHYEVYSTEVWQHSLTDKWDGVINYAEDLAYYLR